jgi:hypothetical protein
MQGEEEHVTPRSIVSQSAFGRVLYVHVICWACLHCSSQGESITIHVMDMIYMYVHVHVCEFILRSLFSLYIES